MKTLVLSALLLLPFPLIHAQQQPFQAVVTQYYQAQHFNGVVLVATDGKIDFLSSMGVANRSTGEALTPQTTFKIASMTKAFTALMIMKLYEEGRIQLEATIGHYLPKYSGAGKDQVTIHQLLTYSSGIENQAEPLGMASYQTQKTLDDYIRTYCSGKLVYTPGEKSTYSNTEYILLQQIIETVSGKKYEQYLHEIILDPLKMTHTGVLHSEVKIPTLTPSYTYDEVQKTFADDAPYYSENYFGAGCMYATVEDMLLFSTALFGHQILSESTMKKMLEIHEDLGYTAYGLWGSSGWGTFKEPFYYRTGGILGATSNWITTLDTHKTILIMSNTDATNLYEMSEALYLVSIGK